MATRASGGASGSPAARKPAPRKPAPRKRPARKSAPPPRKPDPFGQILLGVFRVLRGCWLLLAGTVGAIFRAYGQGARDLEEEHRRDGLGLALLGGAIILAAATWWQPRAVVMHALEQVVRGAFGVLALILPIACA